MICSQDIPDDIKKEAEAVLAGFMVTASGDPQTIAFDYPQWRMLIGLALLRERQRHAPGPHVTLTRTLGSYGRAYDPPGVPLRAYTYEQQPANGTAWNLGCAVSALRQYPSAGDAIDVGLYLLKELQARGLGVFEIEAKALDVAPRQQSRQPTMINRLKIWAKALLTRLRKRWDKIQGDHDDRDDYWRDM